MPPHWTSPTSQETQEKPHYPRESQATSAQTSGSSEVALGKELGQERGTQGWHGAVPTAALELPSLTLFGLSTY